MLRCDQAGLIGKETFGDIGRAADPVVSSRFTSLGLEHRFAFVGEVDTCRARQVPGYHGSRQEECSAQHASTRHAHITKQCQEWPAQFFAQQTDECPCIKAPASASLYNDNVASFIVFTHDGMALVGTSSLHWLLYYTLFFFGRIWAHRTAQRGGNMVYQAQEFVRGSDPNSGFTDGVFY